MNAQALVLTDNAANKVRQLPQLSIFSWLSG